MFHIALHTQIQARFLRLKDNILFVFPLLILSGETLDLCGRLNYAEQKSVLFMLVLKEYLIYIVKDNNGMVTCVCLCCGCLCRVLFVYFSTNTGL